MWATLRSGRTDSHLLLFTGAIMIVHCFSCVAILMHPKLKNLVPGLVAPTHPTNAMNEFAPAVSIGQKNDESISTSATTCIMKAGGLVTYVCVLWSSGSPHTDTAVGRFTRCGISNSITRIIIPAVIGAAVYEYPYLNDSCWVASLLPGAPADGNRGQKARRWAQ